MTKFNLVRHGKRNGGIGDAGLSDVGRIQARATARYLRDRVLAQVYASPLKRAKETAEIIAAVHGLAVVEDTRLRERANWGDVPGQSFAEFIAMWERTTHDPTYLPPVGDSAAQAGARLASFIRDTARSDPHGEIVAVTHGRIVDRFSHPCVLRGGTGAMASFLYRESEPPDRGMFGHCSRVRWSAVNLDIMCRDGSSDVGM